MITSEMVGYFMAYPKKRMFHNILQHSLNDIQTLVTDLLLISSLLQLRSRRTVFTVIKPSWNDFLEGRDRRRDRSLTVPQRLLRKEEEKLKSTTYTSECRRL